MNLKYELKGTKSIKNIYLRIYKSKLDISKPTGFSISLSDWENSKQEPKNDPALKLKLSQLKTGVLKAFNESFGNGDVIDGIWLTDAIKSILNRPKHEVSMKVKPENLYLVDYAEHWIEFKSDKYRHKGKLMSPKSKDNYLNAISKFKDFEYSKTLIKNVGYNLIQDFADYLVGQKYAKSTALKIVDRITFFLSRAIEDNLPVDKSFTKPVWIEDSEDIDDFYLNDEQINHGFNYNFSDDDYLDNGRDNLILSCRLGLRVSDLMHNLDVSHIQDGFAKIKTQKTGVFVTIPIHSQVKAILDKRFGQLPQKMSDSEYNRVLKVIGEKLGFTKIVFGKVFDKETNRKKSGYYPQWMLITAHTGRRSLATNLSDKISPEALRNLLGWSNVSMNKLYNKKTKMEYAEEVKTAFANSK